MRVFGTQPASLTRRTTFAKPKVVARFIGPSVILFVRPKSLVPSLMPTHYDILGVPEQATKDEIRRAYRAAARLIHPDTNPSHDAATKFAALSSAYEVLSDAKSRRAYDEKLRGHRNLNDGLDDASTGQAHYTWMNIATEASAKAGSPSIGQRDFDEMYNAYFGKSKKSRPQAG